MLGIERIDWLLSMSADKYDAIHNAGIDVMQVRYLIDFLADSSCHFTVKCRWLLWR